MTIYNFNYLLGRMPFIGPFVRGFALPRPCSSAFTYLLFLAFANDQGLAQEHVWWHILTKGLLIFAILVMLLLCSFLAAGFVFFHVARRFDKSKEWPTPPIYEPSPRNFLAFVPDVLFVAWGVLFLAGQSYQWLSRVALLTWAAYFVAGCLIAAGRGWNSARQAHRDARGKWYADAGR